MLVGFKDLWPGIAKYLSLKDLKHVQMTCVLFEYQTRKVFFERAQVIIKTKTFSLFRPECVQWIKSVAEWQSTGRLAWFLSQYQMDHKFERLVLMYPRSISWESISHLTHLKRLDLPRRDIKVIPESIGRMQSLECLDLTENMLKHLPESIGQLSRLKKLDLTENYVELLPESLYELSGLEELMLWGNKLTFLSDAIRNMSSLRRLELGSNALQSLPQSMAHLTQLYELSVGWNKLTNDTKQWLRDTFKDVAHC